MSVCVELIGFSRSKARRRNVSQSQELNENSSSLLWKIAVKKAALKAD